MAERLEGWEQRLETVVSMARDTEYRLGEHDCWRVACATIEALTGQDHWPTFRGKYATKREALALIATYGSTWDAAFESFLGVPPSEKLLARRGDLLTYEDANGRHMGVCVGSSVAVLGEHGLEFIQITASEVLAAWRVG